MVQEDAMTLVDITTLRIPEGMRPEIEKRFATHRRAVDATKGFEGFRPLRPQSGGDRYFVATCWDTREHYDAWVVGRDTNVHANDEHRGMSIELLGFEVVQHDEQNEWIATAAQMTAMVQVRVASLQVMPSGLQFLTVVVVIPRETPVRVGNASAGA